MTHNEKILITALRFYASTDPGMWEMTDEGDATIQDDRGEIARNALARAGFTLTEDKQ